MSEVANKWARWLHNPCRLRGPHCFKARGKISFKARGKIRSGPQVGQMATKHLPPWGSQPLRSEGQNQKWPTSGQGGYITPTAYGFPSASERGDKIRSGAQVGHVATKPLPPWRSPTASKRGAKTEVAHKWARWLYNPCRLGGPHRFEAGQAAESEVAHK